ncbi:MAG TPA: hypothetical protein VKZ76_08600 [Edaphocola sp.]|nr:hypothetical protein [Edaphocola sp.]
MGTANGVSAQVASSYSEEWGYIEVVGSADTAVVPDRIYLSITLRESDSRNRISVEQQEQHLAEVLQQLGIDIKKNYRSK